MKNIYTALVAATTSVILTALTAGAQGGSNSSSQAEDKPPVGDFGPPSNHSLSQIIDDGPVVHDYRSAPPLSATQEPWKNAAYEDLWKSVCEISLDIHFVVSKLIHDDQGKARANRWLEAMGRATSPKDCQLYPDPDFIFATEPRPSEPIDKNSKKSVLNQSECTALYQMVLQDKEKLDKAYAQYLSKDEQASKLARPALVEMAGPAAVERLDQAIAGWPHPQDLAPPGNAIPKASNLQ